MLTKNEINVLNLSPTKKDFVQIWNELLELSGKLSERWDPTSTNESDPGIVILKALTGLADKLNYNIDKNILEAFMPTAAQEDSMRKLCDMLGYNMKYYRSAETTVTVKYYNSDPSDEEKSQMAAGLYIPKFTVITNSDQDISYFTTDANYDSYYISSDKPVVSNIPCMEGQLVKCESINDNNIITVNQISENNRFYLPETQIAENGIFIYNVNSDTSTPSDGTKWSKVDNLNAQTRGSRVYKFGYDSYESRPYIEFPESYSELFNEGLFIYYTRTNGVNGNISSRVLTQLELPTSGGWSNIAAESFSVENIYSATTGANAESIKQAYNNFKKTIGTFETLVTCRDYMNKIYSLIDGGRPLVSNILVTDIRNDINRAVTICSCDDAGIFYKEESFVTNKIISSNKDADGNTTVVIEKEPDITHFDLVFYPFKSYTQIKNSVNDIQAVYDASFAYSESNLNSIIGALDSENIKTISHNIKSPRVKDALVNNSVGDIVSINNYLKLNASIATNTKVTAMEGDIIIKNIKIALANAFNMHELDFGDEIPFDSILEVIEKADSRIRAVSLNEPALYTTFSVLTAKDAGSPVITEYAVASDWLDIDRAEKTGRLTMTDTEGNTISTFNTTEAKQIYNKLAVRNILAGRVPLFDYNDTFKASFYEGAYQVTNIIPSKPADMPINLPELSLDNYCNVWVNDDGAIYTERLDVDTNEIMYTETKTPEAFSGNMVAEAVDEDGNISNYITDIEASCKLFVDDDNKITDVTLEKGEFVQFRAPNFTTIKTYPAYVNYNLDLGGKSLASEATPATAISVLSLLNSDLDSWSTDNTQVKWQKVLDYFSNLDAGTGTTYKKTFTLAQKVYAFNSNLSETDNISIQTGPLGTTIGVSVNNTQVDTSEYTVSSLMALSGCAKLTNPDFTARIEWTPEEGERIPAGVTLPKLVLEDFKHPFVSNVDVLSAAKEAIDTALATYRSSLPTQCTFTVYLDFECVPFEAKSLSAWEAFIRVCSQKLKTNYNYQILDFKPIDENDNTILWRLFGDGYDIGKYITENTEKLLKFSKNYFNLLPEVRLGGVYLVENLGSDAKPNIIKNNEEYMLSRGEYLYIEYTPSTTTEDSDSQGTTSITEIYGEGTIIRPSGFEAGLADSSVSAEQSSSYKEVTFVQDGSNTVKKAMYRFGAAEQVEIRDFAKVALTKDSFGDNSAIYIYKNFNNCPELEDKNGSRKYTLKDGEYIFYTDQNKSELAYFTNGTEVTLSGNITLPEFDIIELSTILESGLQEIPWRYLDLSGNAGISFQEYQYITLGAEDTINTMTLLSTDVDSEDSSKRYLSANWHSCDNVEYSIAGSSENNVLPAIKIQDGYSGNGWEANCILELDVTAGSTQTLHSTDKIETSLTLLRASTTGGRLPISDNDIIKAGSSSTTTYDAAPLSFKTNLACQACGNKINIDDVYYNPNKLKGFQLKVFATDEPALVSTEPGKVIPPKDSGIVDLTKWYGVKPDSVDPSSIWTAVNFDSIKVANDNIAVDGALRLSVSLLPSTYGICCIYVDYLDTDNTATASNMSTWIELIPGTRADDITVINDSHAKVDYFDKASNRISKLYLKPGINCIRINKTCRFFIKTSVESQGTLYFDALRLVNSKLLKYMDVNKKSITAYTNGLNLTQLDYLDTFIEDRSKLNAETKAIKQSALVDRALKELDTEVQGAHGAISAEYTYLTEYIPKVQTLVEVENAISKDLAVISELDKTRRTALTEVYSKISNTLENKKSLQEALNNNKQADELEQSLANILSELSPSEISKQQILDELAELKTDIISIVENTTDENILFDCKSMYGNTDLTAVFADILNEASDGIDRHYKEQLTNLANNLEQAVNSEDGNKLLTLLTALRTAETAETKEKLTMLISRLNEAIEHEEAINNSVANLVEAATIPNYTSLYSFAIELDSLIEYRGLAAAAADMVEAATESNNSKLVELVDELYDLIDTIGASESNTKTLRGNLTSLITDVKTKVDSGANLDVDSIITGKVEKVRTLASSDYKSRLGAIMDDIEDCVALLQTESSITKAMAKLDTSNDKQVSEMITSIDKIILDMTTNMNSLNNTIFTEFFSTESQPEAAKFVFDAVRLIWPAQLAARAIRELTDIEQTFTDALADKLVNFKKYRTSLSTKLKSVAGSLKQVIDSDTFLKLFDKIESLLSANEQKATNTALIAALSSLVQSSTELNYAIDTIKTADEDVVLRTLIRDWQDASSIVIKRKLQAALKEELARAIHVDEQLFAVISSIMYPTLSKLEVNLDTSDVFYSKLLSNIAAIKEEILFNGVGKLIVAEDFKYLALLMASFDVFKSDIIEFAAPEESWLPDALIDKIKELPSKISDYDNLIYDLNTLNNRLLMHITSAELVTLLSNITSITVRNILSDLLNAIMELENNDEIEPGFEEAFKILMLENALLEDIRNIDTNRDFYYNVPIEDHLAIELNDSDKLLNTLMNPQTNYDINNVNNSFVISKLDIDYLDSGIKIARSSRLN